MQEKPRPWSTVSVVLGAGVLCLALVWAGLRWPPMESATAISANFPFETGPLPPVRGRTVHPLVELLKLVVAAMMGIVITAVHKRYHRGKPLSRSLEQAEVLLCVSGALMMIIIGDTLARAIGIAGAAGLIRFRTPVEDPKDSAILFLLLGLGMSSGLGAFAMAGLGTIFLCLFLVVLDRVGKQPPRPMVLALVASGPEFPTAHVQRILAAYQLPFQPREISTGGKEAMVTYQVALDPETPLEVLTEQLMSGGAAGLKSVTWEPPKKGKKAEE